MSHKLYTQLGTNAKRALEHRPGNDEDGKFVAECGEVIGRRGVWRVVLRWVRRLYASEEVEATESG